MSDLVTIRASDLSESLLVKQRAWTKRWRAKNPAKRREYEQQYGQRAEVKARRRAQQKLYRKTQKYKAWKEANRDRLRDRARKDAQKRRASIHGTIHNRVSRSINAVLREGKARRVVWRLVGYDAEQLKRHLARQFVGRMSWARFMKGEIDIDHIVPVSMFVLSGIDDNAVRLCWALSNLRPMWHRDNMRKGNRAETLL